jgi:hypothetical protein
LLWVLTISLIVVSLLFGSLPAGAAAADPVRQLAVVNETGLIPGLLSAEVGEDDLIVTGRFGQQESGYERLVDFVLDIALMDHQRRVLRTYRGDVKSVPDREFFRTLPLATIDRASIYSVVLRVRDVNTVESLERARVKADRDARAARAKREQEQLDAAVRAESQRRLVIAGKGWPATVEAAVIARRILIGMTQEQVREALGAPLHVNETIRTSGTTEQWVYPGPKYLYFEDGRLAVIMRSR